MFNYGLILSFVGTHFHGWQIQPSLRTVQGELSSCLSKIFDRTIKPIGCCRTDAGVHAKEYAANFKAPTFIEPDKLLKALNSLLPHDIGVKKVWLAEEKWNSRYSIKGKTYVYRIHMSHARDPFLEPFVWRIPYTLQVDKMREISQLLVGTHDFSGFSKKEDDKNPIIDLEELALLQEGDILILSFRARRFLRYMVRRMVGALVQVGLEKIGKEEIERYLSGENCPYTAPAKGLTLEKVHFN